MDCTPKVNITTVRALLGLTSDATYEQAVVALNEAKKNKKNNTWHIREAERILLDITPDGRNAVQSRLLPMT